MSTISHLVAAVVAVTTGATALVAPVLADEPPDGPTVADPGRRVVAADPIGGRDQPPADLDDRLVLDHGHVDVLSADLDDGDLVLQAKDDTRIHDDGPVYRDPDDIAFHAVPESSITLTDEQLSRPGWDVLGSPGDTVWWLPDVQRSGILFPGWGTARVADDELLDDELALALTDITGPGHLKMFQIGDFGDARLLVDSSDGLPDTIDTRANTHAHVNWFLTEPGIYTLTWRAEGRLPDGTTIHSPPEEYVFVVDEWPKDEPTGPAQVIEATLDETAGSLVVSVDPDDREVTMTPFVLAATGDRWASTGTLRPVTVTDTRPAAPGWSVSAQVSDFVASGGEFGARYLGWRPQLIEQRPGQGVQPGEEVPPGLFSGPGLAGTATLGSAVTGTGRGTAVLDADLLLEVPTTITPGTYEATITLTAV